jgi:hypothetical protein
MAVVTMAEWTAFKLRILATKMTGARRTHNKSQAPARYKAKDLGVLIVTVSKVLRNNPDISEETRERVLQRLRELDYHPNMLARSLVTGRGFLMALIIPDLLHRFFAEIAKSLIDDFRGCREILSASMTRLRAG